MKHLWPLFLVSVAAVAAAQGGISSTRQQELRNVVVQDCGSCHGLTMRGGLGKPLLPSSLVAFSNDALAEVILDGVKGTPMPPWRGLITEAEALWIARELKHGIKP
jgi:cytochrome c55X